MKIFLDTEFTELSQQASLISLGMISENDKTFYAEFYGLEYAGVENDFVVDNVLPELFLEEGEFLKTDGHIRICDTDDRIRIELVNWIDNFNEQVFIWSDCLAYDWVLFCQLFGGAMGVPYPIYYIPFDICTYFQVKGIDPDISRKEFSGINLPNHNALNDAKMIKACWEKLNVT